MFEWRCNRPRGQQSQPRVGRRSSRGRLRHQLRYRRRSLASPRSAAHRDGIAGEFVVVPSVLNSPLLHRPDTSRRRLTRTRTIGGNCDSMAKLGFGPIIPLFRIYIRLGVVRRDIHRFKQSLQGAHVYIATICVQWHWKVVSRVSD